VPHRFRTVAGTDTWPPFEILVDFMSMKAIMQIFTGSHSFTGNALLRNDEIWTGYSDPFVT